MTGPDIDWVIAAACALFAAAVFVWQRRQTTRALERATRAERHLALLGSIAPALTQAATESEPLTCERIAQRFQALVPTQTFVCLIARAGRLVVAAKSDGGYASFLRIGEPCEGDSIVDWVAESYSSAVIGPDQEHTHRGRPLVGSRDRVSVLCVPMLQQRGPGLHPRLVGVLYAERKRDEPFTDEDRSTAELIARFAADALLRAQFADDVKRESEIDQLTGLLSASAFRKRLRQVIEERRHPGLGERADVALLFIDTDRFKLWNDTFGHAVGDRLLKQLADMFGAVAATGGFAGRNGGDEFCIALLDRTKDDVIVVAEGLRERVERTEFMVGENAPQPRIPITISVGVAHFPVDVPAETDVPADNLLEAADAQMYEAKRDGRNRVAYSRVHPLIRQGL